MGFTHYYKIRVYVDDGMNRYKTYKYVFADNEEKARQRILRHYNSQYDTCVKILEIWEYQIKDTMMFDKLIDT
jgi:hypothetical protein